MRSRSFSNEPEELFAKILFKRSDMTVLMREDEMQETTRPVIGEAEARKILNHVSTWAGNVSDQWKARANAQQKKIDTGDPYDCAEVFKGLSLREAQDTLSAADRKQLKVSTEFLSSELAHALGKTRSQARKQLVKTALGTASAS
jgi:RNA polymerase-interacting CarD/CdnL/TRCF family regulator